MIRVLLYGDVDLNLIDGSAVWLASIAEVLGGLEDISVSVLQKTRVTRHTVIQEAARLPRIRFVDPWDLAAVDASAREALANLPMNRLTPTAAAKLIAILDHASACHIILVRGADTLSAVLDNPKIARRVWAYVANPLQHDTAAGRAELTAIRERCARVICQTHEAKSVVLELTGHARPDQILILAPMIPGLAPVTEKAPDPTSPRLGYSGKFSPPYRILEMLDAFELIRDEMPRAEFHIVGDKIHNAPPVPGFVDRVRHRLENTPGVIWHGGVTRGEASAILNDVDIAASWRTPEFDTSVEMSTKVLEYASLGLPVLMNPSPVQQRLFGPNYQAYVSTPAEFVSRFRALVQDPELYRDVSTHVRRVADHHTFESHRRRLLPALSQNVPDAVVAAQHPTILWVGHDFKFLDSIRAQVEAASPFRSLTDRQPGHTIQDTAQSRRLLRDADLIFCEWCLGNAEWYSHHKQPRQKLAIRLHRQEIELPYLERIRWDNVDRIIFIAEWLREEFLSRFPQMANRALLIHNALDSAALEHEKLPDAAFNLGLLGYCPMLKAPHLAVEILTVLKRWDRRYTLFIKGRSPQELAWLQRRPQEQAYYRHFFATVDASRYSNSIVFEPHTDDVATWLSKIGFILSTSDCEGSHQAVAEGMASGSIPVIRNWRGAAQLYPEKYVFTTVAQAVDRIRQWSAPECRESEAASCRQLARSFDLPCIAARYVSLFRELLHDEKPGSDPRPTMAPDPPQPLMACPPDPQPCCHRMSL
jgi:glycosyltransferase involved in cell wall biosynthesis